MRAIAIFLLVFLPGCAILFSGCLKFNPHGCGDQCASYEYCEEGSCYLKEGYCRNNCPMGYQCDFHTHKCVIKGSECTLEQRECLSDHSGLRECIEWETQEGVLINIWRYTSCGVVERCVDDEEGGRCKDPCDGADEACNPAGDGVITCDPYYGISEWLCQDGKVCVKDQGCE